MWCRWWGCSVVQMVFYGVDSGGVLWCKWWMRSVVQMIDVFCGVDGGGVLWCRWWGCSVGSLSSCFKNFLINFFFNFVVIYHLFSTQNLISEHTDIIMHVVHRKHLKNNETNASEYKVLTKCLHGTKCIVISMLQDSTNSVLPLAKSLKTSLNIF